MSTKEGGEVMALTQESEAWIGGMIIGAVVYHFTGPGLTKFLGKPLTTFLFAIFAILLMAVSKPSPFVTTLASALLGYSVVSLGDPAVQWTGQAVVSSPQGVLS